MLLLLQVVLIIWCTTCLGPKHRRNTICLLVLPLLLLLLLLLPLLVHANVTASFAV
jgi:hypothetical protein